MDIAEIIEELMRLARNSNMTFEQLLEWISKSNRDENILPWEE